MSLAAACGWALVRSGVIAGVACPLSRSLQRLLAYQRGSIVRVAWALLLAPFLFPALFVGYALSGLALQLANLALWKLWPLGIVAGFPEWIAAHDALVDEIALDLLLLVRAVPVGALIWHFSPAPAVSDEAVYCRRMALRPHDSSLRRLGEMFWLELRGPWSAVLPAGALMFLLSFQEFELVSRLGRPSWTVWLFDAQALGLELRESLRLMLWPAACQVLVVGAILKWALVDGARTGRRFSSPVTSPMKGTLWGYLAFSVGIGCLVPLVFLGTNLWAGLLALFANRVQLAAFAREIATGLGFGIAASVIVSLIVARLMDRQRADRTGEVESIRRKWRNVLIGCLAVPGLCGSLVVSLLFVDLFQRSGWQLFYGGSIPWLTGLVLWLVPRALLLEVILGALRPASALYLARLLRDGPRRAIRHAGDQLTWDLAGRRRFWGIMFLAYWAYLDLATAQLLAPAGMASAPIRLYIQMHYGRNAVLSAMTCLAVLVPVTLYFVLVLVRVNCVAWLRR